MKVIVFGASKSAMKIYDEIKKKSEIIAFCDNDENKWGGNIDNVKIISPSKIMDMQCDKIIITSFSSMNVIKQQLCDMGVSEGKIDTSYVDLSVRARENFLRDYAKIVYQLDLKGCVAEAGVFQGEFAKIINENFPDRELYLFDTFEGFDEKDIAFEQINKYSEAKTGYLNITSEKLVLSKMKYPEKCVIRKGYFPETAVGLAKEFCFVNLDMDLYKPTLEGLRFFYPKMVKGGIIVIHDYFYAGYEGVNVALKEFLNELADSVTPFPIGDAVSIAIQKV